MANRLNVQRFSNRAGTFRPKQPHRKPCRQPKRLKFRKKRNPRKNPRNQKRKQRKIIFIIKAIKGGQPPCGSNESSFSPTHRAGNSPQRPFIPKTLITMPLRNYDRRKNKNAPDNSTDTKFFTHTIHRNQNAKNHPENAFKTK